MAGALAVEPAVPWPLTRAGSYVTASFDVFYRANRDELVRALAIAIGDEALAAEAVDEAFTRALHRWSLVGSFDEPRAWVYRTARNQATSRFRRLRRDRRFAPRVASSPSTVDALPDPELAAALDALPEDQRTVLVLRYFLDWPVDATADALGVAPGTVKSRTNRALHELHRRMGGSR